MGEHPSINAWHFVGLRGILLIGRFWIAWHPLSSPDAYGSRKKKTLLMVFT